jgi:hypothetical protein
MREFPPRGKHKGGLPPADGGGNGEHGFLAAPDEFFPDRRLGKNRLKA